MIRTATYAACLATGLAAGLLLAPHTVGQGVLAASCGTPHHSAPTPKPNRPPRDLPTSLTLRDADTGLTARVTNLRYARGTYPVPARDKYLVMHVLIHNTGTTGQDGFISSSEFAIHDDSTQVNYNGFSSAWGITASWLADTNIAPGASVAGEIDFQVPTGQHHFSLQWQPSNSVESARLY